MTEIKLFFPSLDKDGLPVSKELRDIVFNLITDNMIYHFKGLTVIPNCVGYYENDKGETIKETVDILYSVTETLNDFTKELFTEKVRMIKAYLNQTSVLIVIDGKLIFV